MRDMEGDTTFVAGLGLVVEQLILKIVMKVPIRNASLDNTHVKSLADLVSCITQKDEQLLIDPQVVSQLFDLQLALSCNEEQVLPSDCLNVLEKMEKAATLPAPVEGTVAAEDTLTCSTPDGSCSNPAKTILQAIASCPSGKAIIESIRLSCRLRNQASALLVKMGSLKADFEILDGSTEFGESSVSTLKSLTTQLVAMKERLAKHPGNEKMFLALTVTCNRCVNRAAVWYQESVLVPHIQASSISLEKHAALSPLVEGDIEAIFASLRQEDHPLNQFLGMLYSLIRSHRFVSEGNICK